MSFSGNLRPKSVSIFLVTPGSKVALLDKQISKHAEPGVAFVRIQARELNLFKFKRYFL